MAKEALNAGDVLEIYIFPFPWGNPSTSYPSYLEPHWYVRDEEWLPIFGILIKYKNFHFIKIVKFNLNNIFYFLFFTLLFTFLLRFN